MREIYKDPGDTLEYSFQWFDWLRGSDRYWLPNLPVRLGETFIPSADAQNGKRYRCAIAGRTGKSAPTWPTSAGTVADGGVTWTYVGAEDRIATSDWAADSALTLSSKTIDSTECVTEVTIAGGTAGQSYVVTNTVTTDAGRIAERSFTLRVRDL